MKSNLLGDIRAEADHDMLADAFVETPDYKSLISTDDRPLIVGRRGSGKSALLYGLQRHWKQNPRTSTVVLAPDEYQVIGMRPLFQRFGTRFSLLRAACRLAWRYALLMELASTASRTYRFPNAHSTGLIRNHVERWCQASGFSTRLRNVLLPLISRSVSPEEQIANLPAALEINQLQDAVGDVLPKLKTKFVLLIDKVDEGFEPDDVGTALANGLVLAAIDMNDRLPACQTKLFIRDNIGRAIADADPDYSRDIEGQLIRLHWDERTLIDLVCTRLRRALGIDVESNVKAWNRCTGSNLQGMSGFRKALRLTLYRPRDILALLNQAFYRAASQGRKQIVLDDLESTAQEISNTRLADLHKEYKTIVPGIAELTAAFSDRDPELNGSTASDVVEQAVQFAPDDEAIQQHFEIMANPRELLKSLYSVGFIGIKDPTSGAFAYCYDGSPPSREIGDKDAILVHPCYWMALGLRRRLLADTEVEEIHDEYEIHVNSQTPELRKAVLSQHIGQLNEIEQGKDGAGLFEQWCLKTVRILFAGQLGNVELHPNRQAIQRRDIVGTVVADRGVWRRVLEDYGTRQVVFEIKNQGGLDATAYRQVLSYLVDEYGSCGFIINRDESMDLTKGSTELQMAKEMYDKHGKLIIRLTSKFLANLLSKARSPQKHDEASTRRKFQRPILRN
ncbi:MAG: ATP-binding protein [Gammaproteobacteria bacterium]|nr:ATP-binding protein [Gammaproteobacteria bacterium]